MISLCVLLYLDYCNILINYLYLTKDFYVDPNLGVGTIKIQDGIVRIGNFETEYDIPDVVWEYITYLHTFLDLNDIKVPTENI